MNHKIIKLLIADDHLIFRKGFKKILEDVNSLNIIGEASNGSELLTLAQQLKPDVILVDVSMPVMDGVMAVKELCKRQVTKRIIALSVFSQETHIMEMLEAGALGYLTKGVGKKEILEAIEAVYENRPYFCKESGKQVLDLIEKYQSGYRNHLIVFSEREKDIIRLICDGFSSKEVAHMLYISQRTVEGHRTRIMKKMRVKSIAGLVTYACEKGLYIAK
ncbi:response regulator [Sediminibacterium goheungense]|uniref:LuxR family two component transcriptional regulator n=1 Tax=Sediminibacterium goheungense TaxID=1086393 RepID=A0A4R6J562_9BACT|nr:response regulator transcription factor [Sediminibacterium goheungense]TDO29375.1 LuxR family two component transcriptional regulator [Sediminibacterium goheungense]